jgi:OmpA-OmpF porin, OOP family
MAPIGLESQFGRGRVMFNRKALLAATALIALSGGAAFAQDEGNWYFGVGLGANWLDDVDSSYDPPLWIPSEEEFDTGWVMTGALGYRWDHWRLEFELGYRDNTLEGFSFPTGIGPNPAGGDVAQFSQMVNALWDLPFGDNVTFSIGGGIGGAMVKTQYTAITFPGSTLIVDGDDYVFAYQGIAGLSIDISDRMQLFAEYRYFVAQEPETDATSIILGVPTAMTATHDDLENHTGLIGVRYHFLEAAAEPPPSQPQPESVVPPPPPKTYIVFFDFNKSNLTAEAQSVVAEAAEAYKSTGSAHVQVVGHTDTVGSSSYNQKLSERRAATVKAEMVRLGVSADAITTEGRGFSDPMVPTGAGVREPQNRRAVIELQ